MPPHAPGSSTASVEPSAAAHGPDHVALAAALPRPSPGNAHPLTRRLYGWLRDRSPADKRLVFEAVSQRAGVKCTSAKQEQAYDAVRLFVERYGYVPAAGEWDSWRKRLPRNQPKPPSASFVRGAFGDWPAVRAAFGEHAPRPDALAHHELLARNEDFSRARLLALVQEWGAQCDQPLFQYDLIDWCRSVPRGHGRPYHWHAFRLRFGTWDGLLEAAELVHRRGVGRRRSAAQARRQATGEQDAVQRERRIEADRAARRAATAERRRRERMEKADALLSLLTAFAADVEGPLLLDQFELFLRDLPTDARAHSYKPFRTLFGPWPALLEHAGLGHRSAAAQATERRLSRRKAPLDAPKVLPGTPLPRLLRWVRFAARQFGPQMSYPQYDDWRAGLQWAARRHGRPTPAIPSSALLIDRCESWPLVKVEAGLLSLHELADQPDRRHHSRSQMLGWVSEAVKELGPEHSDVEYDDWRRRRRRELLAEGRTAVRIPSAELLRKHFGGPEACWDSVVAQAAVERTRVPDPTSMEHA